MIVEQAPKILAVPEPIPGELEGGAVSISSYSRSDCAECGKHDYVAPLHGERGGPRLCLLCSGKWHGKYSKIRKARRVLIKAMKAYSSAGGRLFGDDFERTKLEASGVFGNRGPIEDFADLTTELLKATLALTHPDRHPDRREEANQVTRQLLALAPFVFRKKHRSRKSRNRESKPLTLVQGQFNVNRTSRQHGRILARTAAIPFRFITARPAKRDGKRMEHESTKLKNANAKRRTPNNASITRSENGQEPIVQSRDIARPAARSLSRSAPTRAIAAPPVGKPHI